MKKRENIKTEAINNISFGVIWEVLITIFAFMINKEDKATKDPMFFAGIIIFYFAGICVIIYGIIMLIKNKRIQEYGEEKYAIITLIYPTVDSNPRLNRMSANLKVVEKDNTIKKCETEIGCNVFYKRKDIVKILQYKDKIDIIGKVDFDELPVNIQPLFKPYITNTNTDTNIDTNTNTNANANADQDTRNEVIINGTVYTKR